MLCFRFVAGFILLFNIKMGLCQPWVTTTVDTRTSINFPLKPDSTYVDGKLWLVANDSGTRYDLIRTLVKDSDRGFSYQGLAYSSYLDGLIRTAGLSIIKEEDFTINGLQGKYFNYRVIHAESSSALAKAKIFYFDGVLYAYTVSIADTTNFPNASAARFFASFKINTNAPITLSDTDSADLYVKFRLGHLVFSAVFAVIALALYFIWKKRGATGSTQKWL
jgi:hypothetical protein